MPRFFVDREAFAEKKGCDENSVVIRGEDAAHIALSLRMAVGETLVLSDGEGRDYDAVIAAVRPDAVTLSLRASRPSRSEPPYEATLYQCLPKGEKMETVIQKAVECGAASIVPVLSSRCVAQLKAESREKKLLRWEKIAREAAKQTGRGKLVPILPPLSYAQALRKMADGDLSFLCYESEEETTLSAFLPGKEKMPGRISFLIGPEGGLSDEEVLMARQEGIPSVSLGKRILRTETASGFVLAVLAGHYEL